MVIGGAVNSGQFWLAGTFIFGAFLTIIYLFRVFNMVFTGQSQLEPAKEGSPVMVACVAVLGALSLISGLLIGPSSFFAATAARQMLGLSQ
jgi:NADH:ubiquinone oxidoreductase subunit 5 (subunit L)/multisubunit Na+/H+ antiporter MnhA subunit